MGRDKATLPFGPELMLQRIVRLVSEVIASEAIVVVAAVDQSLPELPTSIRIAHDEHPERGPLEAIAAGLRAMPPSVNQIYATSCDVPLLVPGILTWLFHRLGTHDVAVPFDGNFHHPLAAVYRTSVLATIESLLSQDRLRPRFLFNAVPTVEVSIEELRVVDPGLLSFMNVNHPNDYRDALSRAGFECPPAW